MKTRLIRETDQRCLVENLVFADSYWSRLKGLIGCKEFSRGEGLLFPKCNSVHMWMMSIPIDVVFLKSLSKAGNKWEISGIHSGLRPWKVLPVSDYGADDVLELPAGVASECLLRKGEVLCIVS